MTSPSRKLDLSAKKRALLEALLRKEGVAQPSSGRIPRRTDTGPAPLSFAQERVWFLDQIAGGLPLFNVPGAVPLRGPLDVAVLRRAFTEVARRHEVLRTTMDAGSGTPVSVVGAPAEVELPVVDLAAAGGDVRRALHAALLADARQTFDLVRGPLWQVRLLRLAPDDHVLSVCMHHSISEAASLAVLFDELGALYAAFAKGQPSPLPELPIQYADYACWQRQWVKEAVVEEQLAYWKRQLGDGLPTLQLPLARPRPAVQTFRGAFSSVDLPASLTDPLKRLAQREGATPYMLFFAAYAALLSRYSGQDDLPIGAPIARRDRAELEGLIGFFVNTIVLRADLSGEPTFRQLLGRVRSMALEAFSHSDLPFELLVGELAPDRDQRQNPLFQVMFDLPSAARPELRLPGLEPARVLEPRDVHNGTSKIDMCLFLWDQPGGMAAAIEYNTDLFDADTIGRMLGHYEVLLRGIADDPDRPLASLPILPAWERHRLLVEWNDTARPYCGQRSVHELVQEQVARDPDALAVEQGSERLTYGEWNRRANRLAHLLRGHGVGPDVLVGVCLERSPALVTCLLAVLKAGGAYVPLDPGNPPERQAMMLEDAGAPVLLTQASLLDKLPESGARVIAVDAETAALDAQPDHDPELLTCGDHLAYVIFTSGSTGRPKGVEIPHRGLLNLVTWHVRTYGVVPADRATQLAGLAFDASVWELWPYLCSGASIQLPDEATRAVPGSLLQWLAERRITLSFAPTPLAELMVKEPCPAGMALRVLLTGGDKLHRAPPPGLPFELVNHYGPSESSVVTTCTPVPPGSAEAGAPPIGRPIQNTRVYLLDGSGQPVPIGVPGELYVAGLGLARGYHGRDDLTAERFSADPFAPAPGARMYRTGDLARWRADGQIEFIGRIDDQVKLRGFRIELGEIEAVLRKHDGVGEVLVIVREDRPGERRLVAYWVGVAEPASLRTFAQERLPDYMVPSAFQPLAEFPLTRNGKIDRRALPAPEAGGDAGAREVVAPRSELERDIVRIWRDVLGVETVGIDDSFFDLGGHSLLMVKVRNRLQSELGRDVPILELFKAPTVRSLAAALGDRDRPAAPRQAPPRAADGGRDRRDSLKRRRERLVRTPDRKGRGTRGKNE